MASRRSSRLIAFAVAGAVMLAAPPASASGSYRGQPPNGPAIDEGKYLLGKQVFTGRARLPEAAPDAVGEQAAALKKIADGLPPDAKPSADLPSLAGKLTGAQLEALRYYVKIRYGEGDER